ncbi:TIGR02186 family protein [Algirhabdus cladophorae]|uniref:TIGR02186 family protein n=1 Tax=Algirhabdus cladophorae TaxID=3377108 RepID=UPI003B847B89
MLRFIAVICLLILPVTAGAQKLVLGLSEDEVAITVNFDGSQILVFGAIKHEGPTAADAPLDVIITVRGPSLPATVYRKDRIMGIWANAASVEIDAAPSFYAISSTKPLADILTNTDDLRYHITLPTAIRSVGAPQNIQDSQSFSDALMRIRTGNGLYQLNEGQASIIDQTLFRTNVSLPANLVEGDYTVRVFLTQNKTVLAEYETALGVHKQGLERWLFTMSREQPFAYGLMALAIAISAGWGASAVFRFIR